MAGEIKKEKRDQMCGMIRFEEMKEDEPKSLSLSSACLSLINIGNYTPGKWRNKSQGK